MGTFGGTPESNDGGAARRKRAATAYPHAHAPSPAPVLAQYRTITRPCDRCRTPLWPQEQFCPACCVEFGDCVGLLDALQVAA